MADPKQTAICLLLTCQQMTHKQLRLVQRSSHARYFAFLSLDGSKLLFVWACGQAGRQAGLTEDNIGLCPATFRNQTPRIWNDTPSESLFVLLADDYRRWHSHYHRGDEGRGPDYEYLVQLISKPAGSERQVAPNGRSVRTAGSAFRILLV